MFLPLVCKRPNRVSDVTLVAQSNIDHLVKCRQACNNNATDLRIVTLLRNDRSHMRHKILELNREFNKLGTW